MMIDWKTADLGAPGEGDQPDVGGRRLEAACAAYGYA
jgi:hypothetical protein